MCIYIYIYMRTDVYKEERYRVNTNASGTRDRGPPSSSDSDENRCNRLRMHESREGSLSKVRCVSCKKAWAPPLLARALADTNAKTR